MLIWEEAGRGKKGGVEPRSFFLVQFGKSVGLSRARGKYLICSGKKILPPPFPPAQPLTPVYFFLLYCGLAFSHSFFWVSLKV